MGRHGSSAAPHDPAAYPDGILGRDLEELAAHLGLDDYDLGGFSLGARTVVQAVGEGLAPRRAILAGMGLEGLAGWVSRKQFFVDAIVPPQIWGLLASAIGMVVGSLAPQLLKNSGTR